MIGGLCRQGVVVSTRGGTGGGPPDTTRPALFPNSSLMKPRAMALGAGMTWLFGCAQEPLTGNSGTLLFVLRWPVVHNEA